MQFNIWSEQQEAQVLPLQSAALRSAHELGFHVPLSQKAFK